MSSSRTALVATAIAILLGAPSCGGEETTGAGPTVSGGGSGGTGTTSSATTSGTGAVGGGGGTGGSAGEGGGPDAPLAVAGHWLTFRGRPALLAGDSVTQGWMELGTNLDQEGYIDALADRGISVLMLWSFIGITNQPGDARIGYDAPEIWPWVRNAGSFDLAQFDDGYFARLRSLVATANSRDLVVLITVHDGWTKDRFAGHPFNIALGGPLTSAAQYVELHDPATEMPTTHDAGWSRQQKHQYYLERFCERLIAATADLPNVMYEIFNEGEWYDQADLHDFQAHFLSFFHSRTERPLMINDDHVAGASFRDDPLASVLSFHRPLWSGSSDAASAYDLYAAEFPLSPAKPMFFSEPVPSFEGGTSERRAMMRVMWGTLLAGAGFVVQNDLSFGFDPQATVAAAASERDAMLDLEGHAARFFRDEVIDLAAMAPVAGACSTGLCLVSPGQEMVVYVEEAQNITVDLSGSSADHLARFYNPATGSFVLETSVTGGSAATPLAAPASGDWVVHVRATP